MNAPLTAFLAAVTASGLTAVAVTTLAPAPQSSGEAAAAEATPSGAVSPLTVQAADEETALALQKVLSEMDDLRMELADVRATVEAQASRRAVVPIEAQEGDEAVAFLGDDPASRALILDVLEQKEEDERRAREEERRKRTEERLLERADEISAELGLNRADRDALHSVMVAESERRSATFEAMRESGNFSRDEMRAEMQAIGEWKETELVTRFGEDLASQIDELDGNNDRRGGGNRGGNTGGGRGGGRGN